jgi:hypothetical protein
LRSSSFNHLLFILGIRPFHPRRRRQSTRASTDVRFDDRRAILSQHRGILERFDGGGSHSMAVDSRNNLYVGEEPQPENSQAWAKPDLQPPSREAGVADHNATGPK